MIKLQPIELKQGRIYNRVYKGPIARHAQGCFGRETFLVERAGQNPQIRVLFSQFGDIDKATLPRMACSFIEPESVVKLEHYDIFEPKDETEYFINCVVVEGGIAHAIAAGLTTAEYVASVETIVDQVYCARGNSGGEQTWKWNLEVQGCPANPNLRAVALLWPSYEAALADLQAHGVTATERKLA